MTNAEKVASIRDALSRAKRELDAHREVCTDWDYECDGDCVSCAVSARKVAHLRRALSNAEAR